MIELEEGCKTDFDPVCDLTKYATPEDLRTVMDRLKKEVVTTKNRR